MNTLETIILAVVEGLTEFLPVSSTSHLILTSKLLGITASQSHLSFEIIIQMGAMMAVLLTYYRFILKHPQLVKSLLLAFFPTVLCGLIFYQPVKNLLNNPQLIALNLATGGLILLFIEKIKLPSSKNQNLSSLSTRQALIIGFAQSVSLLPGVSRAAATIIGGILVGLPRKEAVEFSFLLAVPTMIAVSTRETYQNWKIFTSSEWLRLGLGFIVAWIIAQIAVVSFLRFTQKQSLVVFGLWRLVMAMIFGLFWF